MREGGARSNGLRPPWASRALIPRMPRRGRERQSMSRVAAKAVLLSGLVLGIVAGASGCTVQASVKTKTRFTEDNIAPSSDNQTDWAGEKIIVRNESAGVLVNGDTVVRIDPTATRVTATAKIVALANDDDEASAKLTLGELKTTFKIEKAGDVINVVCGHGGTHGSSNSGESGCNNILVTVPAGDSTNKLALDVLSGNGPVNVDVSAATLESLGVNGKGDITVRAPTTQGASISVVAEQADDVNLLLPASFAADEVYFVADADKIVNNVADLQLTDAEGGKKGSRGTPGEGAKAVKLTSKPFAGSSGQVILGTF